MDITQANEMVAEDDATDAVSSDDGEIKKDLSVDEAAELLDQIYAKREAAEAAQVARSAHSTEIEVDAPNQEELPAQAEPAVQPSMPAAQAVPPQQLKAAIDSFTQRYGRYQDFNELLQLARENPDEMARMKAEGQLLMRAHQRYQSNEEVRRKDFIIQELAKLRDHVPELGDLQTAQKFISDLNSYAEERGYSSSELDSAGAREIQILRKAMLWDRAQSSREKARQNRSNSVSVQSPGGREGNGKSGYDMALAKLKKTGRIEDAVKALDYIIH